MAIQINCSSCGQRLEGDDDWVGMSLPCPKCGQFNQIPGTNPAGYKVASCLPLIIAVVLAILINVYPYFRAFGMGDESYVRAGWALYFITVPAAGVLVLVGLVFSLLFFFFPD
jgi:hypothetical protein